MFECENCGCQLPSASAETDSTAVFPPAAGGRDDADAETSRTGVSTLLPAEHVGSSNYRSVDRDVRQLERKIQRFEAVSDVLNHDLRSPLAVAIGRLEMARSDGDQTPGEDNEHLEAVVHAHARMERLLEDLQTLADDGLVVDDTKSVALANFTRQCWKAVETDDATLVVESSEVLQADSSRLAQLLENLFRNSIDHAGSDVTVSVGVLDDGNGFFVEDDGPGIPPADRDRIFEEGFTTSERGTGLGLCIVTDIVENHGWALGVTASSTGGARFEISGVEWAAKSASVGSRRR